MLHSIYTRINNCINVSCAIACRELFICEDSFRFFFFFFVQVIHELFIVAANVLRTVPARRFSKNSWIYFFVVVSLLPLSFRIISYDTIIIMEIFFCNIVESTKIFTAEVKYFLLHSSCSDWVVFLLFHINNSRCGTYKLLCKLKTHFSQPKRFFPIRSYSIKLLFPFSLIFDCLRSSNSFFFHGIHVVLFRCF